MSTMTLSEALTEAYAEDMAAMMGYVERDALRAVTGDQEGWEALVMSARHLYDVWAGYRHAKELVGGLVIQSRHYGRGAQQFLFHAALEFGSAHAHKSNPGWIEMKWQVLQKAVESFAEYSRCSKQS
jgi:hypothetical protein